MPTYDPKDWRHPGWEDPRVRGIRELKKRAELMPAAAEKYEQQLASLKRVVCDPLIKRGDVEEDHKQMLVLSYDSLEGFVHALRSNMSWRFPDGYGHFLLSTWATLSMLVDTRRIAVRYSCSWPKSMDYIGKMDLVDILRQANGYDYCKEQVAEICRKFGHQL